MNTVLLTSLLLLSNLTQLLPNALPQGQAMPGMPGATGQEAPPLKIKVVALHAYNGDKNETSPELKKFFQNI